MSQAFDNIFPIGLGTARFPFLSPETYASDFENAVDLVLYALDQGINYIDVGKGYSTNKAFSVLREAFRRTDKPYYVTVKVNAYDEKETAEGYYREARSVLEELGLESASHFLLWTLMSSDHFHQATRKGSLYDAALRLKEEGRIQHIGTSVHMRHDEIPEVIDSGLFEFVLISYNLVNFLDMRQVLDRAYEKGVDILVMNPLYGGLIPENAEAFSWARFREGETVVQSAVRALLAHPAVKCVLAGASSKEQMDQYLSAVKDSVFDKESRAERIQAVTRGASSRGTFCSYCRYCAACPKGILIPQIMNARNVFSLQKNAEDNSTDRMFFRYLNEKFNISFETSENPCIRCGQCEKKCTQHLNIIQSIDDTYQMVARSHYDQASRKERFQELLGGKNYQKVGFWPASAGTMKILEIYKDLLGEPPFEVLLFDSNSDFYGKEKFGHIVHSKKEAAELGIDCILITSFLHGETIYKGIRDLESQGINVKKLYRTGDVDWWW